MSDMEDDEFVELLDALGEFMFDESLDEFYAEMGRRGYVAQMTPFGLMFRKETDIEKAIRNN